VPLKDEAMSVSALRGKFFQAEGKTYGHILDPRTGQPAAGALLAAVVLPSATETDALSTALLTLGPAGHERIANLRPGMRTLLVVEAGAAVRVVARGINLNPNLNPNLPHVPGNQNWL
jgi:thiamine biosynthesis lipoprotein